MSSLTIFANTTSFKLETSILDLSVRILSAPARGNFSFVNYSNIFFLC